MADYRCFLFDPNDRIIGVETTDQPDDDAAALWGAAVLEQHPSCRAIEVWHLARRVCRLEQG